MRTSAATSDPLFDRFWQAYPRKVGKPKAMKAFANLRVTEETLSQMLAAITQQTKALGWEDKSKWKYIPHPTTWLNQRRWEDEMIGSDQQPDAADPAGGCCTVLR